MIDLVLAEGLGNADGVSAQVFAPTLPGFSICQGQSGVKAAAKKRHALLYCQSYDVEDGALIEIARNRGAVVFAFCDVLREQGFRRAIAVSRMRLLVSACRRASAPFVFCSLASGKSSQRNARELSAFASVIGATPEEKKRAGRLLGEIAGKERPKGR